MLVDIGIAEFSVCVWSLANVYFVAESHETVLCLTFTNGKSFCTSSIPETEQGKPWLLKKQTKTHFRSPKICSPKTPPRIPGLGKHPKPTYSVVNWDQFLFFFMDDLSFFHSFSSPTTLTLTLVIFIGAHASILWLQIWIPQALAPWKILQHKQTRPKAQIYFPWTCSDKITNDIA